MSEGRLPHATPIVGSTGTCRTYRPGRVCSVTGCTTILSRYNPSTRCGPHDREAARFQERTKRIAWG